MSPFVVPPQESVRAISSAHVSMSRRVYPTTTGFPVVPEEAWMRTTRSIGTANSPKG